MELNRKVVAYITPDYIIRLYGRKNIAKILYPNGDKVTIFDKALEQLKKVSR